MRKNIVKVVLVLSLVIGLFALTACGDKADDSSENSFSDYDISWVDDSHMPEETTGSEGLDNFKSLDIYGEQVDSSIFADYQITVIDVWGTYCNPCIKAMPTLAKIHDEYEAKGVNFIGIVTDIQSADYRPKKDFIGKAMEITEMTGADFDHILMSSNIVNSVIKDVRGIPASFIVDSQGHLLTDISYGAHSENQWREILDAYI